MRAVGMIVGGAVCWGLMGGLWFLYVTKVSVYEGAGAVVCGLLATAATVAFQATAGVKFRPSVGMVMEGWRMPWLVVKGTWELAAALWAEVFGSGANGEVAGVKYGACGEDGGSAARRALVVTYTTSTPNIVVLGVVREEGILLYQQVKRGELPEMTKRLGVEEAGR